MAVIPESYSSFYLPDGYDISKRMDNFYRETITTNQSQWAEADIDSRFEANDQTVWSELYGNPGMRHRQFQFNRIKRLVNNIDGFQRRNRKSMIVTPVENGDQETADQFSKVIMWAVQREGMLETISESFRHGSLITGLNLLHLWMDYREDPVNGNMKLDNCASNSFIIDPYFRKQDLSDCSGIWKRSYVTLSEAISLIPDMKSEIKTMQLKGGLDGKFQYMPENHAFDKKKLIAYDEYWYSDFRRQKMIVDVQTGETMEWKVEDEDKLREFLSLHPSLQLIEQEIPTVKLCIRMQNNIMYHGPNPMGTDKYPFVGMFGYFNPQIPTYPYRIQGMVRSLRDAQYLFNRRRVIELDILESQITSGWKYKEGSLVNPNDVFTMAGQGKGLALKKNAMMSDVEQIQAPQVPPSMIHVSESLGKEIQEISGVNEELLGSATDEKAGILSMLRQGAGLTTQQLFFDQLDRTQKQLGCLMIDYIQTNFTPGKIARITEQDPTEQFYSKAFGKYDAAVEDGLNTTTQRQMQFAQMLQLREAGVPISTADLLEASTIQNKTKIIENAINQEKAANEQAQMQSEAQAEELKARTTLAYARAEADKGLSIEREARSFSNIALAQERRMESVKDLESAKLDKIKQLVEIQNLDLVHLEKLMTIVKAINAPIVQEAQDQGL